MNRKTSVKTATSKGLPQTNNQPNSNTSTTPKARRGSPEYYTNLYSPVFSQLSQEEQENFDVIWDWSVSQTRVRPPKTKRLEFAHSPELTIKRHPSNNQITDFVKLKEELEILRDDICNGNNTAKQPEFSFDDSIEDQLLACSQQVERHFNTNGLSIPGIEPICSNLTKKTDSEEMFPNDSFDVVLDAIEDKKLELCSLDNRKLESAKTQTQLPYLPSSKNSIDRTSTSHGPIVVKETLSPTKIPYRDEDHIRNLDDEIERKRKEALLRLEAKKKRTTETDSSPIKCSPEEIEQKRLQALAKLQAKKKQEMIERNRLEAVKRLEFNKRKRALQFNDSVFSKLSR